MAKLNIFALDRDPKLAAQYAFDTHVSKMVTETAQILSTVFRQHIELTAQETSDMRSRFANAADRAKAIKALKTAKGNSLGLYKSTHSGHPSVVWTATHYEWVLEYFKALAQEFEFRFGKKHAAFEKTFNILSSPPESLIRIRYETEMGLAPPLVISPNLLSEVATTYLRKRTVAGGIEFIDKTTTVVPIGEEYYWHPVNPRSVNWDLCVKYYRKYYLTDKRVLGRWTKRDIPEWFKEELKKEGYIPAVKQVKVREGTKQVTRDVNVMEKLE